MTRYLYQTLNLLPTRLNAAIRALMGKPVAYRLKIGHDQTALTVTHGAIVAECDIRLDEPPRNGVRFVAGNALSCDNLIVGKPNTDYIQSLYERSLMTEGDFRAEAERYLRYG